MAGGSAPRSQPTATPKLSPVRRRRGGFEISHYAAAVIYDVDGWVEKNRDQLRSEVFDAVASSRLPSKESLPASPSVLKRFLSLRGPQVAQLQPVW